MITTFYLTDVLSSARVHQPLGWSCWNSADWSAEKYNTPTQTSSWSAAPVAWATCALEKQHGWKGGISPFLPQRPLSSSVLEGRGQIFVVESLQVAPLARLRSRSLFFFSGSPPASFSVFYPLTACALSGFFYIFIYIFKKLFLWKSKRLQLDSSPRITASVYARLMLFPRWPINCRFLQSDVWFCVETKKSCALNPGEVGHSAWTESQCSKCSQ